MGQFLETLYDVIFSPRTAMRSIADRRLAGQAIAAFLLSMFIPMVAGYFVLKAAGFAKMISVFFIMQTLGSLFMWFVGAAVLSLIAELYGGRGNALGLFAAMGFAHIPRIFAVPIWVVSLLLPSGASAVVFAISGVLVLVWTLMLDVLAIQGAHGLNGAKATLVLITPVLAVAAAAIISGVFIGASFMPGRLG